MKKAKRLRSWAVIALGSGILAFGLYNVHSFSGVTEGGVLGLNLLLQHWFGISPAVTNFTVTAACYLLGWKLLGKDFLCNSAVAAVGFSLFYWIFERIGPVFPGLYAYPLAAALIGAVFVGVGTGLAVRENAAICGDDALAMCISKVAKFRVEWAYLISDLTVLALSATYIPWGRLLYSLLTVVLSGQIIGLVQRIGIKYK